MKARRLELGSGFRPYRPDDPEWEHLDANPDAPALWCADAAGPWPWFADGIFDELRAIDVLEHLHYRETARALAEWARILKPGGQLLVQVPAADEIMAWFIYHPERLVVPRDLPQTAISGAQWRLLGGGADGQFAAKGGDHRLNAHYSLWSKMSLRESLAGAGFAVDSVTLNAHPNYTAIATRL